MAGVLEKRERKTYLDDTTPLTVTIVTNRMRDTHVVRLLSLSLLTLLYSQSDRSLYAFPQEYVMKVYRGPNPEESWEVSTCVHI